VISLFILVAILLLIGGGIWGWPLVAGVFGLSTVTDKPSALKNIAQLMMTYDITATEVETAFQATDADSSTNTKRDKGDIAKTLFTYLGAIFILSGIGTYIGMFWDSMGSIMRVFVTLGVSYVLLIVLMSALHEKKFPKLILPLSLACIVMMTGGWFVLIHEVFPRGDNWRTATLFVFGIMALQQGLLFSKYRRTVLAFATLLFIYGFMQVGLDLLELPAAYIAITLGASIFLVATALEKTPQRLLAEPALFIGICWMNSGLFDRIATFTQANWASLIIGVCVMLTAYGLQKAVRYPRLVSLGYLVGSIMAYSGLFDLVQNTPVELLYLAVTASILYACVVLQSRALLLTTVLAMLGFIGYYSTEYFSDSLGWPITLIIMGIVFFAISSIALKVNRKI